MFDDGAGRRAIDTAWSGYWHREVDVAEFLVGAAVVVALGSNFD